MQMKTKSLWTTQIHRPKTTMKDYQAAFAVTFFLMMYRVPIIRAMAIGRTTSQFGMIPARM